MGCDIHAYVEYKSKTSTSGNWWSFGEEFNPGRNYQMFGILSRGVRRVLPNKITFKAKGMPGDISYTAFSNYYEEECTPNPDWHSVTWLSLEEYRQALKNYTEFYDENIIEIEYAAILAAMEKLAEYNYDVRIVMWFDN